MRLQLEEASRRQTGKEDWKRGKEGGYVEKVVGVGVVGKEEEEEKEEEGEEDGGEEKKKQPRVRTGAKARKVSPVRKIWNGSI